MSRLFATAGTKVYIGPAKPFGGVDFTAASFPEDGADAIAWARITGTTNIGASGDSAELITSNQIDTGNPDSSRTRKLKGSRNAGSMTVVCDLDYADPGQLALVAAEKTHDTYAFKIEFNDAPAGGTPSVRYFVALVMSASEELNEANNVMALNTTLEIDSNIVRVAAAESGG